MSGFHGKYYNSVDPKGRLIIPASFRELIAANHGPKLYITNAPSEQCLNIYTLEEWNKLQDKARDLPRLNPNVRMYLRRVIASAMEITLDRQGRVLVPQAHRLDAGIDSEVAVVGQIEKIEIWDKAKWDEVNDISKIDINEYEEALSGLGI